MKIMTRYFITRGMELSTKIVYTDTVKHREKLPAVGEELAPPGAETQTPQNATANTR